MPARSNTRVRRHARGVIQGLAGYARPRGVIQVQILVRNFPRSFAVAVRVSIARTRRCKVPPAPFSAVQPETGGRKGERKSSSWSGDCGTPWSGQRYPFEEGRRVSERGEAILCSRGTTVSNLFRHRTVPVRCIRSCAHARVFLTDLNMR